MRQGVLIAGKYRLQRLLGDGAAGEVWSALNERTDREVALKLITGADRELRERAVREARAMGRVSHRNVVEVFDAGETDRGDPFLVMPRLEGETLGERLRREVRLPPQKAAAIALEVARGLAAAHAVGVIHRDLKPSNIFLHRDAETGLDQVKVLDFGVSKMMRGEGPPTTRTGDIVGSPAYMSPEQARAD
ncbi:MAG TPA: serine/threonine-protein kinase, partial [Candidatus Nanopelagicales bacterium]|nr:serine/threonine-protein kinase [Candidatus Nanopelagicales bacterium]